MHAPEALHALPHVPPVHVPEQQLDAVVQDPPSEMHDGAPQTPKLHSSSQQSLGDPQGWPSPWHVSAVHCPMSHAPLQHDVPNSQSDPAPRQVGSHCPASQTPLQHSAPSAQPPWDLQPADEVDALLAPPLPPPPKSAVVTLLHARNGRDARERISPALARRSGVTQPRLPPRLEILAPPSAHALAFVARPPLLIP